MCYGRATALVFVLPFSFVAFAVVILVGYVLDVRRTLLLRIFSGCRGSPLLAALGQFAGAQEDGVEHRWGEDAREGVLLGGVIAAENRWAGVDVVFGPVTELRFGSDAVEAQGSVPGEGAEADYDLGGQQGELAGGVWEAQIAFGRGWLIPGRGAAHDGGDPESS